MFTSYFAKKCNDPNAVSIALYSPKWYTGREYKKLAPPKDLLEGYKNGKISVTEYKVRYYEEVLDLLNPQQVFDELGDNVILLCWEKSGEFCHRNLVSDWFKENLNIEVREMENGK